MSLTKHPYAFLFALSESHETGTVFLTTRNNQIGYVILEKGNIQQAFLNGSGGDAFLGLLADVDVVRHVFKADVVMDLPDSAKINSSALALDQFGYREFLEAEALAEDTTVSSAEVGLHEKRTPSTNSSGTMVYRGQSVHQTPAQTEVQESDKARMGEGQVSGNDRQPQHNVKKTKRIYRGQVLED